MNRPPTAEEKLERILYILPTAAKDGGVPLHQLADALEMEPRSVLRELEEATARIYFHPGAAVEPFTIMVEADRVDVRAPQHFNRPVRLNAREALALGMGLRVLAAESAEPRRTEVLQLAARLEAGLAAPDISMEGRPSKAAEDGVDYVARDLAVWPGDDSLRGLIADGIEQQCICEVWYLKSGSAAPERRRIAPHRLIHANGCWYAGAVDADRGGMRFFRLDRMLEVTVTGEAVPPLSDEDAATLRRAPYVGVDEIEVTVRYERQDTVVTHRVADLQWLVRHVLHHGGSAIVEAPEHVRDHIAQRLEDELLPMYEGRA